MSLSGLYTQGALVKSMIAIMLIAAIATMSSTNLFASESLPSTNQPVTNKIILIHGLSGDASGWNRMKNMLAKQGYELILFDLAGHGTSEKKLREITWKDWQQQVQKVINKESQNGKVSIFGHSMGGLLAYIVGNQNVDKVENIVTFGAAFQNISLKDTIIIHLSPILKYVKPTYEISQGHSVPLTTLRDFLYLNTVAKKVVKTNKVRALALHGKKDISVPVEEARQYLEGKPNIEFKVLEQSHYPRNDNEFSEIAEQLRSFLSHNSSALVD